MMRGTMEITIPGKYVRELNRRARERWAADVEQVRELRELRERRRRRPPVGWRFEYRYPPPLRTIPSKIASPCRLEICTDVLDLAPEESEELFRGIGVEHGRKMLVKRRLSRKRVVCLDVMIFEPDGSMAGALWIAPSYQSSNCWFCRDRGELILSRPLSTNSPCLPCPFLYGPYLRSRCDRFCEAERILGRGMHPLGFLFDLRRKRPVVSKFCAAEPERSVWWSLSGALLIEGSKRTPAMRVSSPSGTSIGLTSISTTSAPFLEPRFALPVFFGPLGPNDFLMKYSRYHSGANTWPRRTNRAAPITKTATAPNSLSTIPGKNRGITDENTE